MQLTINTFIKKYSTANKQCNQTPNSLGAFEGQLEVFPLVFRGEAVVVYLIRKVAVEDGAESQPVRPTRREVLYQHVLFSGKKLNKIL